MPYCTQSDIEKRIPEQTLIELTDDAGADQVDTDAIDAAISDADEEIDAHIGLRHTLPLTTVPTIVGRWSTILAVCHLFARRDHLDLPKQWEQQQAAVRRQLEAVAKGTLSLGADDPDGTPSPAGTVSMSSSNPTRVFSRDNLSGW
jgi:phage gp36-like protein